jgi:hypothetical protein
MGRRREEGGKITGRVREKGGKKAGKHRKNMGMAVFNRYSQPVQIAPSARNCWLGI